MVHRRKIMEYSISGFLILFAILYLFPYIWMISMSFKPDGEIFSGRLFPTAPTWEQYQRLLFGYRFQDVVLEVHFADYFKNTDFITTISLILVLFTDALAAYAFAKLDLPGKTVLFWVMIGTMLLPV